MPGTEGNSNRMVHGNRSSKRHELLLTDLGGRYPSIYHSILAWRRRLEDLVTDSQGAVSLGSAAIINLAARLEMTARIAEYRVSKGEDPNLLKLCCQCTMQRNQCLERLGIDQVKPKAAPDPGSIYLPSPEELDATPCVAPEARCCEQRDLDESEDQEACQDAPGDATRNQNASGVPAVEAAGSPNHKPGAGSETGGDPSEHSE